MADIKFPRRPALSLFMVTELPEGVAANDTPQFRKDLYLLCQAYYTMGWEDAACEAESAAAELVYTVIPNDVDD